MEKLVSMSWISDCILNNHYGMMIRACGTSFYVLNIGLHFEPDKALYDWAKQEFLCPEYRTALWTLPFGRRSHGRVSMSWISDCTLNLHWPSHHERGLVSMSWMSDCALNGLKVVETHEHKIAVSMSRMSDCTLNITHYTIGRARIVSMSWMSDCTLNNCKKHQDGAHHGVSMSWISDCILNCRWLPVYDVHSFVSMSWTSDCALNPYSFVKSSPHVRFYVLNIGLHFEQQ